MRAFFPVYKPQQVKEFISITNPPRLFSSLDDCLKYAEGVTQESHGVEFGAAEVTIHTRSKK